MNKKKRKVFKYNLKRKNNKKTSFHPNKQIKEFKKKNKMKNQNN